MMLSVSAIKFEAGQALHCEAQQSGGVLLTVEEIKEKKEKEKKKKEEKRETVADIGTDTVCC